MTCWCWQCGVPFEEDERYMASACPDCREKLNKTMRERLCEFVPVIVTAGKIIIRRIGKPSP